MSPSSQSSTENSATVGAEAGSNREWFSAPENSIYFENLTKIVDGWDLPGSPFDGDVMYEMFFDKLARGLHRRKPRHLVIRRERGVGDHAVMIEMARRAKSGEFPSLANSQFLRCDCRFVPDEESRVVLNSIFASVANQPDLVLCIDGLASLLSAGGGGLNRPVLLSQLAHCSCRIIGLVTPHEFEEHFGGRQDMTEFFSDMELHEPSVESAEKLVQHFAGGLEQEYSVKLDENAVRRAVFLTHTYIPSSRLPAKAIQVLSDVCDDLDFDCTVGKSQRKRIVEDDVVRRVSEISGIPEVTLAGLSDGVNYGDALRSRIVGQDHVIEEVATELGLIRAGMIDAGKPASVMLFVGQTGTGKTELAKVISQLYSASKRLKTFTLGNFSEPHSVSGIIGVPAGYVGHDQGGRLVNELNADPYSVFLLDEADKAHPDVMQPFLNLFDEGWIVDQRGVKGNAERAIFILTTNVGQRQIAEMQKKGKSWEEIHDKLMESLSQIRHAKANRPVFSAEFLARLKRVIIFKPLDGEAMAGITRQLCDSLVQKWSRDRRKTLVIGKQVVLLISEKAQTQNEKSKGKEGGRIVRKLIANLIEASLQTSIAETPDAYRGCKEVIVSISDSDKFDVSFQ